MPSSARSGAGHDELPEPIVRRLESLKRLGRTDQRLYNAKYTEEKKSIPDLDRLLSQSSRNLNTRAHNPSPAPSAATPQTGLVGGTYHERRRSARLFSCPQVPGTAGNSLAEVSAISMIGDEENTNNDLEVAGWSDREGGSGGTLANHRSVEGSLLEGLSPTHATSDRGQMASADVEVTLMSPSVRGLREGGGAAVTARGPPRSPTGRTLLDPGTRERVGEVKGASEDDSRLPGDGSLDGFDTRPDHSRSDYKSFSGLPASPSEGSTSPPPPDVEDMYCIRFFQPVLLRSGKGRYLRVRKEEEDVEGEDVDDNASITTAATAFSGGFGVGGGENVGTAGGGAADGGEPHDRKTLFGVDAEGIGIGDPAEVVSFISIAKRHDRGAIKYGESVSIKSMHGNGKFLKVSSFGTVVFARIHAGRNERWTILPYSSTGRQRATDLKGKFVRKGERIELEHTVSSGSRRGAKILLMIRPSDSTQDWEVAPGRPEEYAKHEYEALEVAPAGVPYLPAWRIDRRYLTGDFMLDPPPAKTSRAVATLFGIDEREAERIECGGVVDVAGASESGSGVPLPEAMQEELILNDLLYALMGIPGSYVVVKGVGGEKSETPKSLSELEFAINRKFINGPLASFAERMLPLCSNYVWVNRFVTERSQYEFGKVAHALAAGMQRMLREYLVLIAKLESQLLQPSMLTMEKLAALTVELREFKGGEMLRRMTNLAGTGGDEGSRQLYTFLLHQASVPYLEMLETWIYHGDLNDHYGEFMIGQLDDVHKRDVGMDFNTRYWSGRYLLRPRNVIASLDSRRDKILTTGKYLNVVRECGRRVDCPLAGPIPADPGATGEGLYAKVIDGAYGFASRCLMDLIVREGELLPRLESIKHYFLLDRGDFFEHFLDCAEGELDKIIPQISLPRLESLLHLSVQMSSASQDPFKDDLGVVFSNQNLLKHLEIIHRHGGGEDPDAHGARTRAAAAAAAFGGAGTEATAALEWRDAASSLPSDDVGGDYVRRIIQGTAELRGVESLMMSYKVRWPLSLVLSKKSLTKYQLLFRHIFFAKHVLRLLSKRLMDHQEMKQLELRGLMGQSYLLRQRMVHFMQSIVYYMMVEVVEPRWHEFMDDMRRLCGEKDGEEGETLDDILRRHDEFLDTCLTECLLTNVGLLKVMISCLHFGDEGARFAEKRRMMEMQEQKEEAERVTGEAQEVRDSVESAAVGAGPRSVGVRNDRGVSKGLSGGARTAYFEKRSSFIRAALDSAEYRKYIEQSRDGFDASLHVFTGELLRDAAANRSKYQSHLSNLFALLDYNGFFTRKFNGAGRLSPPRTAPLAGENKMERRAERA